LAITQQSHSNTTSKNALEWDWNGFEKKQNGWAKISSWHMMTIDPLFTSSFLYFHHKEIISFCQHLLFQCIISGD
jgi:hypothetical protein